MKKKDKPLSLKKMKEIYNKTLEYTSDNLGCEVCGEKAVAFYFFEGVPLGASCEAHMLPMTGARRVKRKQRIVN